VAPACCAEMVGPARSRPRNWVRLTLTMRISRPPMCEEGVMLPGRRTRRNWYVVAAAGAILGRRRLEFWRAYGEARTGRRSAVASGRNRGAPASGKRRAYGTVVRCEFGRIARSSQQLPDRNPFPRWPNSPQGRFELSTRVHMKSSCNRRPHNVRRPLPLWSWQLSKSPHRSPEPRAVCNR
jgi:hypothetical protein